MKIRQKYVCGKDVICIRFVYNKIGAIAETIEIDEGTEYEMDEYAVPFVEVTDEFFFKIINHKRLK